MSQKKIVIDYVERDAAHRAAGHLQEVLLPTPDAVTVFADNDAASDATPPPWRVEAYFSDMTDERALLDDVARCIQTPTSTPRLEDVPDNNWVALSQSALPPVQGGRWTVFGRHDRPRVAFGPHAILIEAGEAFGTAHHATTYGCLLAIDQVTRRHHIHRALDLGCGSAVLAIALARAQPDAKILASDLDQQSVVVATENVRQNRASHAITTLVANGLRHPRLRRPDQFDLVIANILAGPLLAMAPDLSRSLAPGGHLILSGILSSQANAVQATYLSHGLTVCSKMQINDWTTLTFVRRPPRPPLPSSHVHSCFKS